MKLFAKTLLGAAVATAMAGAAQAESFIDDSSLKIKLRNVYFNEMGRSDENKKDRREWVQAVIADYKSGYFMDMVGFDLSAGGAWGLSDEMDGVKNSCKASNLPVDSGDKTKCETNDISGVHQAYAKFKAGSGDVKFDANFGKKKRKFKTYSDSGSRALPAGSYGLEAGLDIYGLDLYAANLTAFSPRNQSYFKDDLTNGSEQIDYLRIVGAKYSFDFGLGLHAELNRSDDYLKQNWYQATYDFDLGNDMTLGLIGRYGTQEENGKLYGDSEHESKFYDLVAELEMGAVGLRAGYTKVSDGVWDSENFDEDHGKWTSNASNHADFNAEDEKTWVVGASYDFADLGVEGLNAELYYAKATDGKDGGSDVGDRWERGTIISYDFGGSLKGLNIEWENYTNRGAFGDDDEDGNRFYVNYSFKVF